MAHGTATMVVLACAAALGACASPSPQLAADIAANGLQAPAYAVGDRWVYRVTPQFRAAHAVDEVQQVTAVGPHEIVVHVTAGGTFPVDRVERWAGPGRVVQGAMLDEETRRFAQPLERLRFPLVAGTRWNQWVDQVNDTGRTAGAVNRHVRVEGLQRVVTPAGAFDAMRLTVIMRLDDETPFRHATECTHIVWYAPAVRGVVREERRAKWQEKGSGIDAIEVLAQHETVELVAFAPGR